VPHGFGCAALLQISNAGRYVFDKRVDFLKTQNANNSRKRKKCSPNIPLITELE